MKTPELTLHLLDGSQTAPVQTWKLKNQVLVRIGRAEENDVVIRQPSVSRAHVELHWREREWELVNVSRMGTRMDGFALNRATLDDGATFQLGEMGPVLRLQLNESSPSDSLQTVSNPLVDQGINQEKKTQQVDEISRSDYFRNIQRLARQIKASGGNDS